MSKLKVFLRQNNTSNLSKHSIRPRWFSYEACYKSIKKSNDIELTVLIDGTEANHHFKFNNDKIIELTGGSDAASLLKAFEYIKSLNLDDNDIVYLVEDDYLHAPGWDKILLEVLDDINGIDYATLYDHNDKYTFDMYRSLQSSVFYTKSTHWRSTPSTCNTYAGKWKTFKKHWDDYHIKWCMPQYTHGGYDHTKFLKLWENGSNLVSSIPGYSTHCHIPFLSPIIDWEKINDLFI